MPGQELHSDIQYFLTESFSNAKYALIFVDAFSGYLWGFPIKEKTSLAVLDLFQTLDRLIETQFSVRIKTLHSDNGGEYVNTQMTAYLSQRGIIHHTIVPHRHQMNGIAERANRSAADAVRAMLADAHLPPIYWAHAFMHYIDVRNMIPNSHTNGLVSPYELLHKVKPNLSHLRTFGCIAYARVPPETRRKLDSKSQKGIFVGLYNDAAYKIMLLNREIVRSKDVIFQEEPASTVQLQPLSDTPESTPTTPEQHPAVNPIEPPQPVEPPQPRPQRTIKPTTRRIQGLAQETAYKYMDNPPRGSLAQSNSRKTVAGHLIPLSMSEALKGPDSDEWHQAGLYELGMLLQHDVWDEVPRPPDSHVIRGKWVFSIKEDPDGSVINQTGK